MEVGVPLNGRGTLAPSPEACSSFLSSFLHLEMFCYLVHRQSNGVRGTARFTCVGSPLANWPCLTHSSPTSYAAKDRLAYWHPLASGHITAIPGNIQASSKSFHLGTPTLQSLLQAFFTEPNFLSSEAQAMSIGDWTQHGKWTANPFDFPCSFFSRSQRRAIYG